MTSPVTRPVTLLIAALGGEGGGVLTGWIVAAAEAANFPVQATSIPGVAQRTGATTYYIEIWPEPISGKRPVLSLAPAPGEVDVFATTELLEAGRAVQGGLVTPERTQVVASSHRVYTTAEKMVPGDGRFDPHALMSGVKARARTARLIDMDALAQESGAHISAVLLGAIAGANVLPLSADALLAAIRATGKAVEANLRGFEAGRLARAEEANAGAPLDMSTDDLIAETKARARAFQGSAYADLLADRLRPFQGGDPDLLRAVVKGLGRRMVYNDVIRVAALKTRKNRVDGIRATVGAGQTDVVRVRDYFRPGLAEIADILPQGIGRVLSAWSERRAARRMFGWAVTLDTTSVTGHLMLKALSWLRPMRPMSLRFKAEQAAIEAWLADIAIAQNVDPALALEIAHNARLIKGYGATHARGVENYDAIRARHVVPALAGEGGARDVAAARARALSDKSV